MKNWYKSKKKLNFIVYNNGSDLIIFKNSNYKVSKDGSTVIHNDAPIDISGIK